MYQSPVALDYTAAYQQDEARRYAAHRQLEHAAADGHTPAGHRLVAMALVVLMILVVIAVI
jgi:hypothetical protein